jgi:NADPH-dependent 2,4-dienoyl-CoA reductase/sulfur reductase-like enzyme/nitrite reductase/ring-hydroxylating ferredoxin subunit
LSNISNHLLTYSLRRCRLVFIRSNREQHGERGGTAMGEQSTELVGPDLERGIPAAEVGEGEMLAGHAAGEPVLVARFGGELFAIGAACSHYGTSLALGLLVDGTVRCPSHHAAFDLRTGEAVRAPALRPVACWEVEERDATIFVRRKKKEPAPARRPAVASSGSATPESVVIVGAGAAGSAAAERLRREGFAGRITLIGAEEAAPYDRPNVSKDYLAGNAPEEWMPLWADDFYREQDIRLVLGARVAKIDAAARQVRTLRGEAFAYDALLLATGADPVRLPVATHHLKHVFYLRTMADARAIIAAADTARRAVVVGSSFIGMEVAAALRAREMEVHVVSHDPVPFHSVLGHEAGAFFQRLHERNGVTFHLGEAIGGVSADAVTLKSGRTIAADLVVVGIGVRPGVALASWSGVALERDAVAVNEHLETSVPGIYAAGDLVRWPDPRTGTLIRSEHWVVAQRQGQTAAMNILGARQRFEGVPFFWTAQFDATLQYVGHAERWDRIDVSGSLDAMDCTLAYRAAGPDGRERTLAVATLGRDRTALTAERDLERLDWDALDSMVPVAAA